MQVISGRNTERTTWGQKKIEDLSQKAIQFVLGTCFNFFYSSSSASPLYSPVSFCGIPVGAFQNKLPDLSLDNMIGKNFIPNTTTHF